jgi:hypothetical protein
MRPKSEKRHNSVRIEIAFSPDGDPPAEFVGIAARNECVQMVAGDCVYEGSSERIGLAADTAQIGDVPGSDTHGPRRSRPAGVSKQYAVAHAKQADII